VNRAQTGLPALAIALLVMTVFTGLGLGIADGALVSAERNADERHVATSLAEWLVAAESPLTERANVFNATRLARLDASGVARSFPVADGRSFRLRVNESTVAATGDVRGGTTFRRLVVVERQQTRTIQPDFGLNRAITLPRRTTKATVALSPPTNTTVTAVRANDRVLLRNASGLSGQFEVALSRFETTQLRFQGGGSLPAGSVEITYAAPETAKTSLVVKVDG